MVAFLDLPETRRAKDIGSVELGENATLARLFFENRDADIRCVAKATKEFLIGNQSSYDVNGHKQFKEPWFPINARKILERVARDEQEECCHHLEKILDERAFEHGLHHHLQTAEERKLLPDAIGDELPFIAGSPTTSVVLNDLYRVWFFAEIDPRNLDNVNKTKIADLLGFISSDGAHAKIRNLILAGLVSARRSQDGPNAETGWSYRIGPLALAFFRIAYRPAVHEMTAQLLRIDSETLTRRPTANRR